MGSATAGRRGFGHGRAAFAFTCAATAASVIGLAACGGGSSSTTKTTATSAAPASGSSTGRQATAAYRQCLQQHGVTFGRRNRAGATAQPPASRPPLSAADRAKRQAAQQACQSKLPQGLLQQREQDLAAYRSCMRDHGVTLPSTATGNGFGGLQGVDRSDPKFQAANKVCAPLLPTGGRFAGPRSTGTSGALGARARSAV